MKKITVFMVLIVSLWGQTRWERFYGGSGDEAGKAIQSVPDGFIIAGYTSSFGSGSFDLYTLKLNEMGDTMWAGVAGGSDEDYGECLNPTDDGGVIVAGLTYSFGAGNSDVYIVKFDSSGEVVWSKTYGGQIADEVYDMERTDWGYILVGRTYSFGAGNFDMYALAIDDNGDTLWTRTYGGYITDGANSVLKTDDGFLFVGYTYSYGHGNYDVYVVKTDTLGNPQWEGFYGGTDDDVGTAAVQTDDGGYIVVGYSYTFTNGADDIFVVKISPCGTLQWQTHYGGAGTDEAWDIVRYGDVYFIAGFTGSEGHGRTDGYIVAIDENGHTLWLEAYGGQNEDGFRSITLSPDSLDLAVTGYSGSVGAYQLYAVRFHPPVSVEERPVRSTQNILAHVRVDGTLELFVAEPAHVDVKVYDISGRLVQNLFSGYMSHGNHEFGINSAKNGVYFIKISTPQSTVLKKAVLLR